MNLLHHRKRKTLPLLVLLVVGSLTATSFIVASMPVRAVSNTDSMVYLPVSMKGYPNPPEFGAQITPGKITELKDLLVDSGIYWLRVNAFDWNKIEPTYNDPPTFDWSQVKEGRLKTAANNGLEIIATIRFAPPWALPKASSYPCSPIKADSLDEFARFLNALVKRYSVPPYNIKYWELGNEPDIDPSLILPQTGFGCWGDHNDEYYGGGYYAEMLKAAYPAIKAADPEARVLIGGLLLDCDPTNPPAGKDCKSSKFLEGILDYGGGAYFDIVSYHGYAPYSMSSYERSLYYDETFPSWSARGGMVLGKLDFIREKLAEYGANKPVMLTEAGLICYDCNPPPPRFFETQADYVVWLFVRSWAAGMYGTTWYTFDGPGWRNGGLLDENQEPRKSYDALQFLIQLLGDSYYTGELVTYPGVQGHIFKEGTKTIWVLWSKDGSNQSIQLPAGVSAVYNRAGKIITPADDNLSVNKPVYVEFSP